MQGAAAGRDRRRRAAGLHGWADAGDARRQRWAKREIDGGSAWLGTRRSRRQRQWRSGSSGAVMLGDRGGRGGSFWRLGRAATAQVQVRGLHGEAGVVVRHGDVGCGHNSELGLKW
ncbi:hypothetical protein M0R45_006995 [Rubus argutus]|uniref:Uncharacterized protein n=1 Tax=Rubus argutus TaxID=59490 RepID=A0AAW1YS49_RUBAR